MSGLGCVPFCHVGQSCSDGAPCQAFEPVLTAHGVRIGFCPPPACDPVSSACAETCGFYAPTQTACFSHSGFGSLGESCDSDTFCQAKLACDDVAKRCTRYCRLGSADCGEKPCLAANQPPLSLAGVAYGYCEL